MFIFGLHKNQQIRLNFCKADKNKAHAYVQSELEQKDLRIAVFPKSKQVQSTWESGELWPLVKGSRLTPCLEWET